MATTITPSIGAGALFTQQGQGTTPGYSAIDLRRSDSLGLQEGVYGASDFMVVQRLASPNMSVDIGMPTGGFACVQGDSVFGQGLYTVPTHSATVNEVLAPADATNPRVDQVILEVLDNVHDASGSNLARTRVLTGSATLPGATLTNRTGAVTLPANALLLADILVGAGVSSVDNTKIRDRRKWARGASLRLQRGNTGSNYTLASTTYTDLDATNLAPRIECSGLPLEVSLRFHSESGTAYSLYQLVVDGTVLDGGRDRWAGTAQNISPSVSFEVIPSAGSHVIKPQWKSNNGNTVTLYTTGASDEIVMTVREVLRQNTANNTTTSG